MFKSQKKTHTVNLVLKKLLVLTTRVPDRLRCCYFNRKKNKNFAKRNANGKKHTTRQTETPDSKLPKIQTGSRKPPEKVNF
jgi:hypothetical protein